MGDYNIETLFIPHGLVSCNTNIVTRQSVNKTALIHYIITENFKKCFVTESILNSDQYGTVAILDEKMMMKQMPIKKLFSTKRTILKKISRNILGVQIGVFSGCHKMLTKWCCNFVS